MIDDSLARRWHEDEVKYKVMQKKAKGCKLGERGRKVHEDGMVEALFTWVLECLQKHRSVAIKAIFEKGPTLMASRQVTGEH